MFDEDDFIWWTIVVFFAIGLLATIGAIGFGLWKLILWVI